MMFLKGKLRFRSCRHEKLCEPQGTKNSYLDHKDENKKIQPSARVVVRAEGKDYNRTGYVSDFSPDGKLFASLDAGKLKVWDIKDARLTPQEYVPNLHLSVPYTCFVWFKASAGKGQNTLYIALGTSSGGVDLYSYATNKVESKLKGNGHAGAVTSICVHNNSTLYTSGVDCEIFEWSLTECCVRSHFSIGTTLPTCIVSLPSSNSLLIGCKQLFQWSLGKRPALVSTFNGHMFDVKSMELLLLNGEEYVVSTAKSSREIYLWKIGSKKNPKATFLMEYAATFVSCSLKGSKLIIAAVTGADKISAGGVVHLFIVDDISEPGKSKKVINPKATVAVAFDSQGSRGVVPIPIVAACSNFSEPQNILIGYGNSPVFRFEDIQYNLNKKKQTLQREDPRVQVVNQEKTKQTSKRSVQTINDNTQYGSGAVKSTLVRKSTNSELSLDNRLKALSVGDDDDAIGHSQVELLKQALQSRDPVLIRTVLSNKDENVIRSTLKRLPDHYVPSLIDELTSLTQKKTANVQIAVCWLKLLLLTHASQLMSLGKNDLYDRFGSLLGNIKHRTSCLVPLTELSGRLDFLMNQIKRNTDDDPIFNHENLLVIEDAVSDEADADAIMNIDMDNGDDEESDDENSDDDDEDSDDDMDDQ